MINLLITWQKKKYLLAKRDDENSSPDVDTLDIDILKDDQQQQAAEEEVEDQGSIHNGRFRTDKHGRPDYGKGKINQFFDKISSYIGNAWASKFSRDY